MGPEPHVQVPGLTPRLSHLLCGFGQVASPLHAPSSSLQNAESNRPPSQGPAEAEAERSAQDLAS